MYDFVCVFSYEYEMPVSSVTKHNVAVLMPSYASPSPFSSCLTHYAIIILPRYLTAKVDEYFISNHILIDCLWLCTVGGLTPWFSDSILTWPSDRQWHCPSPAHKQELWGWITVVACRSTFFPSCRTSCMLDWDADGGAASPSMDNKRTTAVASALCSFRLMKAEQQFSFGLFSVALVSMIAE